MAETDISRSDPFIQIMAYPGGNKFELEPIVNTICQQNKCEGNWKATDMILEMIKRQYSGN